MEPILNQENPRTAKGSMLTRKLVSTIACRIKTSLIWHSKYNNPQWCRKTTFIPLSMKIMALSFSKNVLYGWAAKH